LSVSSVTGLLLAGVGHVTDSPDSQRNFLVCDSKTERSTIESAFNRFTKDGLAAITKTSGNDDGFVILRGGTSGTNFDPASVKAAREALRKKKQAEVMMIDCSHGNSKKDHRNQPGVAQTIGDQLRQGEDAIVAVMIESNIEAGNQKAPGKDEGGLAALKRGQSITDACIDWDTTVQVLEQLADAVRTRREVKGQKGTNGHANQ